MIEQASSRKSTDLRLLPAYTGTISLEQALDDPRALRLLWLEILINDRLDISPWQELPAVQEAYAKACRWYTNYRSLIESILSRAPLPVEHGAIDLREFRTFAEALRFVADHA